MKELFENLNTLALLDSIDYLVDTCFFIWSFEHQRIKDLEKLCSENRVAITTFNASEFLKVEHDVSDKVRHSMRKFLKESNINLLIVPIDPGHPADEHAFVKTVLPELDAKEHDPSDAVILAAAIRTGADVLTRDKHDMFNTKMENFLKTYRVKVLNTFP